MNLAARDRLIVGLSLLAGGGDFLTGALLVLAPDWSLALMRVPPVTSAVFLRFVGVFVACVGASYLAGLLAWRVTDSRRRLRFAWEMTILFRLAAGGFVAAQIAGGSLPWQWASVPAGDWAWALAQGIGLRAGLFGEERP